MKKRGVLAALLCIFILFSLCSCTDKLALQPDSGELVQAKEAAVFDGQSLEGAQKNIAVQQKTLQNEGEERSAFLPNGLVVHYIDVGQGDAALVMSGGQTMLIDGGRPKASSIIYTYLKKQGISGLDYIVCSHADDDHIGGLSAPLANMPVKNVIAPKTEANTNSFRSLKSKIAAQGLTVKHPRAGEKMNFGDCQIEFCGPISENDADRNNGSIVMKIVYGETSFLFTGDAEREEEKEILEKGYDISATVLKVGHHGSKNSTTYPFLREIMPEYAIISVGENSYGHPTDETLSRLRDADVKVFRTDMQGDIIATSNGKTVAVTPSRNADVQTNPTVLEKTGFEQNIKGKQGGKSNKGNEKKGLSSVWQAAGGGAAAMSVGDEESGKSKAVSSDPPKNKSPTEEKTEASNGETPCKYIGNINTKKFHYPSCSSVKQMKEKNKVVLNCTRSDILAQGFAPCGRCNP